MTTSELIALLKKVEYGASGRAREITFRIPFTIDQHAEHEPGDDLHRTDIEIDGTGDGVCGAELTLKLD